MNLENIFAIIISILALIFSLWQFISERKRSRQEATIHAFDKLEEDVFSEPDYGRCKSLNIFLETDSDKQKLQVKATLLLSKIEHFAVGVNTNVYDIETLNRMAGRFIIGQYEGWKSFISEKENQLPENKHYDEFKKMVTRLCKLRS